MATPVLVPKLGPAMVGGVLAEWYFPDGASVARGEPVFRLECDYVAIEVEAETPGVLRHQASDGDICRPGSIAGVVLAPGERMPDSAPDEFGDPAPLPAAHRRQRRPEDEEIIDWTQQRPATPTPNAEQPGEAREPILLRPRSRLQDEPSRDDTSFDRATDHDQDGHHPAERAADPASPATPPDQPPAETATGWFAGGPALGMFSGPSSSNAPRRVLRDEPPAPAAQSHEGDLWRAIAEDAAGIQRPQAPEPAPPLAETPVPSPTPEESPAAAHEEPDVSPPLAEAAPAFEDEVAAESSIEDEPAPFVASVPVDQQDEPAPIVLDVVDEEPALVAPVEAFVDEPAPAEPTPPEPTEPVAAVEVPGPPASPPAHRAPVLFVRASANVSEAAKMRAQLSREWRAAGLRPGDEDIVVRAVARAVRESPAFAGVDDAIGLCALEEEGIAVRILRDAATRPFRDAVVALAEQAPHSGDDQPSACTVTSFGEFSLDEGIPQLRPGQVIAITMGAVRPGSAYNGDRPEQVPMMTLTLAYDAGVLHEGAAVRLLARIRDLVEAPYALLVA